MLHFLIELGNDNFSIKWNVEETGNAILCYLKEHDIEILLASVEGSIIPTVGKSPKNSNFLVNRFIKHIYENDPEGFNYLETIVKGNMLANALILPDVNSSQRKFNNTDFYFDTRFILQLLGLEGPEQQKPCIELLELLYLEQGNLKVFHHTVEEVKGILKACSRVLFEKNFDKYYGTTLNYLVKIGYESSDIELILTKVDNRLKSFNIISEKKPDYDTKYQIDESELEKYLREGINYLHQEALVKDVDSMSAIFRMRKDYKANSLEDSVAIFVTKNTILSKTCNQYFSKLLSSSIIPVCLTDFVLTNMVWLKRPSAQFDLPRTVVIANCFAALNPSEQLWKKYCEEIKKLANDKAVTIEDYYLLRFAIEVGTLLMDTTLGDVTKVENETVIEILNKAKEEIAKPFKKKYIEEKETHIATKSMLEIIKAKEYQVDQRIEEIANKFGKVVGYTIFWIGFLILAGGMFYPLLKIIQNKQTIIMNYILTIILGFMLISNIFNFSNTVFGISLKSLSREIEKITARVIKNGTKKLLYE